MNSPFHSPTSNSRFFTSHSEEAPTTLPFRRPVMKFDKRNPFSFPMKTLSSVLSLVSCLFFFVFGLTFGIGLCFVYRSFSVNLQITNGQFSILTSQTLRQNQQLNVSSTSIMESNVTTPNTRNETWREFLKPPSLLMHDLSDEELIRRALMVREIEEVPSKHAPKVAFMFLIRGPVILAPLWEKFFKGHQELYSIYVHSDPSYNGTEDEGSVFHDRRVPSKEVQWGKANMIEAERRLLANALLDFSNQQFVLLSESCIPLFNFSTIYSYLMNSTENFVESYDLPGPVGRGRYSKKMKPMIRLTQWRKGSQWFSIDRDMAIKVISDRKYFPIFQRYCSGSCYADEHYLPTFLGMKTGIKKISNRTLTWVDWSRGGAHPSKFIRTHVTPDFLEKLRSGNSCKYNGKITNLCFLFARKFTHHALDRLLRFAPNVMHFNK